MFNKKECVIIAKKLRLQGDSFGEAAANLTRRGYTTKNGCKILPSTVQKWLTQKNSMKVYEEGTFLCVNASVAKVLSETTYYAIGLGKMEFAPGDFIMKVKVTDAYKLWFETHIQRAFEPHVPRFNHMTGKYDL